MGRETVASTVAPIRAADEAPVVVSMTLADVVVDVP